MYLQFPRASIWGSLVNPTPIYLMSAEGKQFHPNLYLVGFMGTGKSAVGRAAAQRLGYQFIDSDQAIEESQGRSIKDIFESDGETAFRAMEKSFVQEGHPKERCVVSCGGGLISLPGILKLIQSKGPVVCLLAAPQTIYDRVKGNQKRPLLNVDNPLGKIEELLKEREPVYRKAGTEVLTDCRSIADVAAHVVRVYRAESRSWQPK